MTDENAGLHKLQRLLDCIELSARERVSIMIAVS